MLNLRSLIFNLAFYVNLIVLMIFGLPMMLFGRKGVFFMARLWGSTSVWLLETICNLRVEYRGVENIPDGGYLIAAKHQSFVGTGYFDAVQTAISAGAHSTGAMAGSTETAQFTTQGAPAPKRVLA